MPEIRAAVVGVGHLGRLHALKYARSPRSELVAVVDENAARAQAIAGECGTQALSDYRALRGRVDVASIAVPASAHHRIARYLLRHGIDLLIEKPIARTLRQADGLVRLARRTGRVLRVGHLERFNPAARELARRVRQPLFIEVHRLAPFKPRGTDVDVAMDLMIHDLDLVHMLVGAPPRRIEACGTAVLSDHADIANARLSWAQGCVANLTASRISTRTERKLRLFQADRYLSADLNSGRILVCRRTQGDNGMRIDSDEIVTDGDSLTREIEAFLDAVEHGSDDGVSGEVARSALATALKIGRQLEQGFRPGPHAAAG